MQSKLFNIYQNFLKTNNFLEIETFFNNYYDNIIKKLSITSQSSIFHAEGDVWTHTKMTINELVSGLEFSLLSENNKFITFYAMVLHDFGKAFTTKLENGDYTAKGHSRVSSQIAKEILYKNDIDYITASEICFLITYHQNPFYILEKKNYEFLIKKIGWLCQWENLLAVSIADMKGRICIDQQKKLDDLNILTDIIKELDFNYFDEYTRWRYLQSPETIDVNYKLHKTHSFEVFMLSGLPGCGKDSYIQNKYSNLPEISLDNEREQLKLKPGETNSEVIRNCTEKAKILLAKKQSFVFNATNLIKDNREKWLNLFFAYNANVNLIYLEKDYDSLIKDDKSRGEKSVGKNIIDNMISKMDLPNKLEVQQFCYLNSTQKKMGLKI